METTTFLAALGLGLVLGALVGVLWARSRPTYTGGLVDQAEVMQGLDRLSDQVLELERQRASWQGQLHQHVSDLQRETSALSTALRKPQVRGRWGEMHLRRAVELAGLVDRCDFSEQVRLDEGALRPDLVVNLVGGRQVVVDAKVPLDAYLDASGTTDEAVREAALVRHARQLRHHVDQLAAKQYWRSLPETPEFVVLFVPAESFLAAALETEPTLLEHAAQRQVVLATPTTLIALLRTVAHGWRHEVLADRAREVQRLGRDLHDRLGNLNTHLGNVGRSLNAAVGHYNQAVGSLESRVLVASRRFQELGVVEQELPGPRQVEATTRALPGADTGPETPPGLRSVDRRAASGEG